MEAAIAIAALGFASTLCAAWLTARWQGRATHAARRFDLKVQVYGECAQLLFEFERAVVNRAKARLAEKPTAEREPLRQEVYRTAAQVRAIFGRVALLAPGADLQARLERVQAFIGETTGVNSSGELTTRHEKAIGMINEVVDLARADLWAAPR